MFNYNNNNMNNNIINSPRMNNFNINNNFNNNMNNNINMNNNNYNNNSNQIDDKYKGILPRSEIPLIINNEFPNEEEENVKNIIFVASTGYKVVINIPISKTISELFLLYAQKTGIGPNALGGDIIFLFDAGIIPVDEQKTVGQYFPGKNPTITVIDKGNVLGARELK